MVKNIMILVVVVVISLPVVTTAGGAYPMEKFDWLPSESAHVQYPMKLVEGTLILRDGSSLYVPSKAFFYNGWGELGSTHVVGKKEKALPTKVILTWFSYAENKFFAGEFVLPYDSILDHFRKMISPRTGKTPTYYRILVGMGPEGAVSVWIATEGIVVEVGTYKGTEVTMDWKAVALDDETPRLDNINEVLEYCLSAQHLRELKEHGVPPGISDHYSKQYSWTVSVSGQVNPTLWLKTLNGEREHFDFSKGANIRSSRGVPKTMRILWENIIGRKYGANILFDEAEITAAYKKLSGGKVDHPMQLQLDISDDPRVIHTSLKDAKYVIMLNKTEIKAFRR